jgi:hypothetical protein
MTTIKPLTNYERFQLERFGNILQPGNDYPNEPELENGELIMQEELVRIANEEQVWQDEQYL